MPLNYMHALRRYTPCAGGWQNYITRQLDRHERHVLRAVAQVVVDEERQREALERRCAALETEIAEFDQERSPRLRAVPTARGCQVFSMMAVANNAPPTGTL